MKRPRGRAPGMARSSKILLRQVPDAILASYAVSEFGLAEGMSLAAQRWRSDIAGGVIPEHDMRAAIVPVAALLSAMLEALLRAVPITDRDAALATLADESDRIITGRPQAVIVQSGIL